MRQRHRHQPFAAELARVSVWIGEIQWMQRRGFDAARNPVLKPLETIECRDALLNEDGTAADWPKVNVIIGNPPFLGASKFLRELGQNYSASLRKLYIDRVPAAADFVTYWFAQTQKCAPHNGAGFVATNSVRHSASNVPVKLLATDYPIFAAWSDEPWVQEGAAVRVSIICVGKVGSDFLRLNGQQVAHITSKLTTSDFATLQLPGQEEFIYRGPPKIGQFDVDGDTARRWLELPPNVNGCPNSDVIRPLWNGYDIVRYPRDKWIIDFANLQYEEASLYEDPFKHVETHVRPFRANNRRDWRRKEWWRHGETVPALRRHMALRCYSNGIKTSSV